MRKIFGLFILILVFLITSACGNNSDGNTGSASEKVITMKAGVGLNDQHPQYKALLKFKEEVEKNSNGQMIVETYHSGQLGDDKQMIENLQLGSQEITIPSTAPLANFVPEFNIFNFPFLFPNTEVADSVLDGEFGTNLLTKLDESNLVGLNYWEEGFYNITNNERPIESVEDLKGLKIRTMENKILLDVFKELGANPTPMAFGEVYSSLQQGVVDGQTNPPSQIYEAKFHETQKYMSATNDFYGVWVFLVSKEFYEGLNEEQQKIIKDASMNARDFERQETRNSEQEYVEKLQEEGIEYNTVSPEALQEMKDTIQPVLDEYSKEFDKEMLELLNKALEDAQ
ncbi:TRAP transporter substrate-binding protein [Planococcus beigongshangi]|uniref:TRAP transporter substrate-binding protein n=1 Tax=Planococcus beigongshangi TaxID=2782536 RepID=UPI00193BBAD6|nr:TRAP transporter substrate-binding protein [Planococcus beigongshangi]